MTIPATADHPSIPTRTAVPPDETWNLADLFPDDTAWETAFQQAGAMAEAAASFAGKLTTDSNLLWQCLQSRSDLSRLMQRIFQYAYLHKDLDTRVSSYQAMTQRAMMLSARAGAAYSFVEPELLAAEDAALLNLAARFPEPAVYDFYIAELIRSRAHIRSAEVEALLAESMVVASGPDTIFSMLDDADIVYPEITDEHGNRIQLTKQRYAKLLESGNPRVRREAHEAFYRPYKAHSNTLGASLAASVQKDLFYTKARRFDSCLERALDGDHVPTSVYLTLLDAAEAHADVLHRYVGIRKKILKLDQIGIWDMNCPLFPEADFEVSYAEAVAHVREAVAPLGSTYQRALADAFASRWVDVWETEGKAGGAYSWGSFDCHPFVLMNYNKTVDAMFTLAHEMGHALHSWLSNRTQPYPKAQYSIFVAEVASTLNEGLLLRRLLETATSDAMRKYLLGRQLENTFGTFFNQIMYARFELTIHQQVESGEALSPDSMTELWRRLSHQYYGPEMTVDDPGCLKWSRIPHFYNMFYVYQYATSYAASQAILTQFLGGEATIIDRYLALLSSGGSDHPIALLKKCGVDMSSPDPVLATVRLFDEQVRLLESMV